MPLMYAACRLAESQHLLINAERCVKAGLLGNAAAAREARDYWWRMYRALKA